MIKYDIVIDSMVEKQINDIFEYTAHHLANEQSALAILERIKACIRKLEFFPESHPLVEREPWRSLGVRKTYVNSLIIYFYVDGIGNKVHVLAIVHSKRNQFNQINKLKSD